MCCRIGPSFRSRPPRGDVADLEMLLRVPGGARLRDAVLSIPSYRRRPRSYWFRREDNFGDQLGRVVLRWILSADPIWVTRRFAGKIVSVGSILGAIAANDSVWGTGSIDGERYSPPHGARFLAVRGPLTRSIIHGDVPEVYGDPAILIPQFHHHPVEKRFEIGIIPHYVDRPFIDVPPDPRIRVIDVQQPWRTVVDEIRSCERTLSSSLHGIIVSESYGIPCSWVRITDKVVGGSFKFDDYYLATGREKQRGMPWRFGLSKALEEVAPAGTFDPKSLIEAAEPIRQDFANA